MDKFEEKIIKYAIFSPNEYREADMKEILEGLDVEKKYMGQLSRVYLIKNTDWVIKEGRWDLSFELYGDKRFPFPARLSEAVLKKFSFTFLPKKEHILDEYGRYLQFAQYFGYFENKKDYYHPNLDIIHNTQRNIRNSLTFFKPELEKKYGFKLNGKIDEILRSNVKTHNFLPKEYQLIGTSLAPENKGKLTSLMFQEFIHGQVLRNFAYTQLNIEVRKQLILLIYLILLMHYQTGIMADTRPKYSFFEAFDWITRTENILVSNDNKLKFIDTRWFWDTKSNYVRQGLFIPRLIIQKAKTALNELVKLV